MRLDHTLKQTVKPAAALIPAQLQSLKILSMTSQELDQFLEDEHMENPMLDLDPTPVSDSEYIILGEYFQENDYAERDLSSGEFSGADGSSREPVFEPSSEDQTSLEDYLRAQIRRKDLSPALIRRVEQLIAYIDPDTGFFTESPELLGEFLKCGADELNRALSVIRKMEPAGIGAFSLADCLTLQLERQGQLDDNLKVILDSWLEELAEGHLNVIGRALHISTEKVKHYIRVIHGLNPYPARNFGSSRPLYVIPDLRARYEHGRWDIQICRSRRDSIRLNTLYMQIARTSDDRDLVEYFKEKIARAKAVILAIEQRETTLLNITRFALTAQSQFAAGTGPRQKLSMRAAAEALGISPSTVSRAAAGKYIDLPAGTCALKELFTASQNDSVRPENDSQQDETIAAIEQMLREEDPAHPFSDQKIADRLTERGFRTARRTVAKYREIAGIAPASKRKRGENGN